VKGWKLVGFLLDLALLAASLATGGPVGDGIRAVALVAVVMVGGLVVFCAVVLTVGVLAQREPPFRF
jgi:hypothetical protein